MDIAFEQKIRQRAYEIWMAAGMVEGAAESHWLLAKNDVLNETQMPAVKAPAAKLAKAAPKAVAKPVAKPASKGAPKTAAKAKAPAKSARKAAATESHAAV